MAVQLTDVPDRFDVVFQLDNGSTYGFLLADTIESDLPFRSHKAVYGYSPTFLERQNTSELYGDNFQDFFLTGAQDDFSLGEGQQYFKVTDPDRSRRYWAGTNIDNSIPGNVTLAKQMSTFDATGIKAVEAISPTDAITARGFQGLYAWLIASDTKLWWIKTDGTFESSFGFVGGVAHTAGAIQDICTDGEYLFLAGINKIITVDNLVTITATRYDKIAYMNNLLFAWRENTDTLYTITYAGAATSLFSWKALSGAAISNNLFMPAVKAMVPFGGSLLILRLGITQGELWIYDGAGVKLVAEFPPDFFVSDMCVSNGIAFISGYQRNFKQSRYYPAIYYYVNGSFGKLCDSGGRYSTVEMDVGIAAYGNGIVFTNPCDSTILQYDIATGSIHTIASTPSPMNKLVSCNNASAFIAWDWGRYDGSNGFPYIPQNYTTGYMYGIDSTYNSVGVLQTSQYTFDNTLNKTIRAVKIDADIPVNTSIDLAYQLDGCGGTYTALATGVSSGVEYNLPSSTSGTSISVQVTLNSTDGASTPTLKRLYVRAAPTLQQFRKREYVFDLSGGYRDTKGKVARQCRDGTPYPYDGFTAAQNLISIATQTIPFTVVDRFSTPSGYTAICDLQPNQSGYDGFAVYEVHPGVYIARVNLREV